MPEPSLTSSFIGGWSGTSSTAPANGVQPAVIQEALLQCYTAAVRQSFHLHCLHLLASQLHLHNLKLTHAQQSCWLMFCPHSSTHTPAALPSLMLWPKPSRSEGITCTACDSSRPASCPAGNGSNSGQLGPAQHNTAQHVTEAHRSNSTNSNIQAEHHTTRRCAWHAAASKLQAKWTPKPWLCSCCGSKQ